MNRKDNRENEIASIYLWKLALIVISIFAIVISIECFLLIENKVSEAMYGVSQKFKTATLLEIEGEETDVDNPENPENAEETTKTEEPVENSEEESTGICGGENTTVGNNTVEEETVENDEELDEESEKQDDEQKFETNEENEKNDNAEVDEETFFENGIMPMSLRTNSTITLQYWAYIEKIDFDSTGTASAIGSYQFIDTSSKTTGAFAGQGPKLPTNGNTTTTGTGILTAYLERNEDDELELKYKSSLEKIYKDLNNIQLLQDSNYYLNRINIFPSCYRIKEIWKLKENASASSSNPNDFYRYNINDSNIDTFYITTNPDDPNIGTNCIYVEDDVIRIVAETVPVSEEKKVDAEFYDYDITTGKKYDRASTSTSYIVDPSTITSSTDLFAYTYRSGINSTKNYNGATEGLLGFGNNFVTTGLSTQTWGTHNYPLNASNGNSFNRCNFGLAKKYLENENNKGNWIIKFDDSITAPKLFNETLKKKETVAGKTTYTNRFELGFKKVGDRYTLKTVRDKTLGNNVLENLDKFTLSGVYDGRKYYLTSHKIIFANNFWPMDTYATENNDFLFGQAEEVPRSAIDCGVPEHNRQHWKFQATPTRTFFAKSADGVANSSGYTNDDGKEHNSYFGMHFTYPFTIPDNYVGPMEYAFVGDDDLWVYLDGELICDIGGIHGSTGEYVDIRDYINESRNNIKGEHRLDTFFLERGSGGSTCWMTFNIPNVNDTMPSLLVSDISLTKEVVDAVPSDDEYFEFVVTFTGENISENQTFNYIRSDSNVDTISSGGTIRLRDGETITIKNVPVGTEYEITECPNDNYVLDESFNSSGTLSIDNTDVLFKNVYNKKGVSINKTWEIFEDSNISRDPVTNNPIFPDVSFVITGSISGGIQVPIYNNSNILNITLTSENVTQVDNTTWEYLWDGLLPKYYVDEYGNKERIKYKITETYNSHYYVSNTTILKNITARKVFDNVGQATGFKFRLLAKDAYDNTINPNQEGIDYNPTVGGPEYSYTWNQLYKYQNNIDTGDEIEYEIQEQPLVAGTPVPSGKIVVEEKDVFKLTNTRKRNLTLTKIDSVDKTRKLGGAVFTLEKVSLLGTEWIVDENFTMQEAESSSDESTLGEFTFHNLEAGIYRLTETTAPDRYNLLKKPVFVQITDTTASFLFDYSDDVIDIENTENIVGLSIMNKERLGLPNTGMIKTDPTTFVILLSIILILVYLNSSKNMRITIRAKKNKKAVRRRKNI